MRGKRDVKLMLFGVISALIVLGLTPVRAASANISHSYNEISPIPNGSLVSLDASKQNYVDLANSNNSNKLLGIAVAANDSLLAVDESSTTIQIATSGIATTLVSNVNGNIDVGDQIAVSPFNGIGMKADPGTRIIGLAQTAFNSASTGITSEQVKDKANKNTTIKVGYVRATIGITTLSTLTGNQSLNSLQKLAKSLTGHTISTFRVVASLVICAVALIALITLVYSAIYASIISVGRNPLAKYAVFRTLGSVLGMALLTAVVTGITVFFLLR